jgi:hypothetical protein
MRLAKMLPRGARSRSRILGERPPEGAGFRKKIFYRRRLGELLHCYFDGALVASRAAGQIF